jgi:hypothetical protein
MERATSRCQDDIRCVSLRWTISVPIVKEPSLFMESLKTTAAKKSPDINVLRCLNSSCQGLLAYEVDSENVLYVDLVWTARVEGDLRYFPCPKCRGKNVVESFQTAAGQTKHRITRWQP